MPHKNMQGPIPPKPSQDSPTVLVPITQGYCLDQAIHTRSMGLNKCGEERGEEGNLEACKPETTDKYRHTS